MSNPIDEEKTRLIQLMNACPCPVNDPCSKCCSRANQLGHLIDAAKEMTDE